VAKHNAQRFKVPQARLDQPNMLSHEGVFVFYFRVGAIEYATAPECSKLEMPGRVM